MTDVKPGGLDPEVCRLLYDVETPPESPQLDRGAGLKRMAIHAARREFSVVRSRAMGRGAVWRRRANLLLGTPRERAIAWLTAGVVLRSPPSASLRPLLSKASFVAEPGPPSLGADNSIRLLGRHEGRFAVLRVGRAGTPSDPAAAAHALKSLAGVPAVPALLGRGDHDGWEFTIEEFLAGTPAKAVTSGLVADLINWFGVLAERPLTETSRDTLIASITADAGVLGSAGPGVADRVRAVAATLISSELLVPAACHGDLWAGNILLADGHLSGIVDWDGFIQAGAAGVDLVHMLAVDLRLRRRESLGAVAAARPWARPEWSVSLADVLETWGGESGTEAIDAVGRAWWLAATAASLRRIPRLKSDVGWVRANVEIPARVLAP